MSEREPSRPGEVQSQADRTLLGVAPPRVESSIESPLRSPVFVRAGTSVADVEPPPLPRMALPSRPPARLVSPESPGVSQPPSAPLGRGRLLAWLVAMLRLPARVAGVELALWMVLAPAFGAAALAVSLLLTLAGSGVAGPRPVALDGRAPAPATPKSALVGKSAPGVAGVAELSARPAQSLSSSELLRLAEGRAELQREAAKALRQKIESQPGLSNDKALHGELLRLASDALTAREALGAMAQLPGSMGADLLYEVWTGTSARTDATELARALLYSPDLRPRASEALSVALDLRLADSCDDYKSALPKALKDGDRRALHLLTKLTSKRGCGPKKADDCFACLRDDPDELKATISAVRSRRPPGLPRPAQESTLKMDGRP